MLIQSADAFRDLLTDQIGNPDIVDQMVDEYLHTSIGIIEPLNRDNLERLAVLKKELENDI